MKQRVKVTFGNISKNEVQERVFDTKQSAMMWINHEMVRQSGFPSVHELYFRLESYGQHLMLDSTLPF